MAIGTLGYWNLAKSWKKNGKIKFKYEYLRRTRLIVKSKLNGTIKIKAINTSAISLLRDGTGLLKWTREELEWRDRKSKKLMTMYITLLPESDIARLYVPRHREERVAN